MITWEELTPEEQQECLDDINQSGYDFDGSEEYATDEVAKDLWIRGYSRAADRLTKLLAATLREAAAEIELIKK